MNSQELAILQTQDFEKLPILQDFQTLLHYTAKQRLPVSAQSHLLPRSALEKLNENISRTLHLTLQRPVQKSYPHLHGLYLLLRATGLGLVLREKTKTFLTIDTELLTRWNLLTPAEQYGSLLVAWLMRGYAEILGERDYQPPLFKLLELQRKLQKEPIIKTDHPSDSWESLKYRPGLYNLALAELFGMVSIQANLQIPARQWPVQSVQLTAWGSAVFALLQKAFPNIQDNLFYLSAEVEAKDEQHLIHTLQQYFPEFQNAVIPEEPIIEQGTYIFKVMLGKIWRQIAIPAQATLETLCEFIIDAFNFDHDHLYDLQIPTRFGYTIRYVHPYLEDESRVVDEYKVGEVGIRQGSVLQFTYDFGDNWQFEVITEEIRATALPGLKPKLLEKKGRAPQQYGSW